MTAIGNEICCHMAGGAQRLPLVREVFTRLARREDSQYSYLNSLIALDPEGNPAAAIVSYDGARLYELRQAFVDEANALLGWNVTQNDFQDETSADEFYLDSLMVSPAYRRRGLAGRLIALAAQRARENGKPLGLLVDYDNPEARRLYVSTGFRSVGERPFAGTMMEHMQMA